MAGFVERVVIEVQARTQGAVKDIRGMGSDVKQAEGLFGKAKAGLGGLTDTVKNLIGGPAGVVALGTAVAAAAIKLADGFATAALAADDMANRTGLATEEASRWIAVADDIGISAEAISGAAQKLVQNMGKAPDVFEAMGITATDTNTAMQQALDLLNRTPEGAQRAALGVKIFGKAWGSVAELTTMSAREVQDALEGVSDAQVFDADEVAKAKRYRAAMDDLSDALADVGTELGETVVPAISQLATDLAGIVAIAKEAGDALGSVGDLPWIDAVGGIGNVFEALPGPIGDIARGVGLANEAQNLYNDSLEEGEDVAAGAAGSVRALLGAEEDLVPTTADLRDEVEELDAKLRGAAEALDLVNDSANDALGVDVKLEDAYADLTETLEARTKATQEGSREEAEATRKTLKAAQDVGQAEVDKAKQMAAARGETLSTNETNAILAQSYENLAKMLAPNDPLRKRLTDYAQQLRDVPESADTTITADSSQAQAEVLALWRKLYDARMQADLLELRLRGGSVRSWLTGVESAPGMSTTTVTVNVPPTLNPSKVLAAVGAGNTRDGGLRRG